MNINWMQFLIVCPLVGIGGFVDAVAGGGGLISLPAYMIAGLPVHFCIGTNKMSSLMGTSVATYRYARNGFVPWKLSAFCAACALAGSSLGANLALMVNDYYFKILMLFILPVTMFYVTRKKNMDQEREAVSPGKELLISMFSAFGIGVYDGFYGPGTGTFLILLLTGLAHMRLQEANGVAKVINWSTNVAAFTVYIMNGKTLVPLGLVAGCFGIIGNYMGTKMFTKDGAKIVRPLMILVLSIFFIRVLYDLLG